MLFSTTINAQEKCYSSDRRPVYLALCGTDEVDGRADPHGLSFGLLDCHLNGFGLDIW